MLEQGFESVDFVYVSGDAYVDHPSFGCAIITRTLQAYGYSCAILPQPTGTTMRNLHNSVSRVWGFLYLPEILIPW